MCVCLQQDENPIIGALRTDFDFATLQRFLNGRDTSFVTSEGAEEATAEVVREMCNMAVPAVPEKVARMM